MDAIYDLLPKNGISLVAVACVILITVDSLISLITNWIKQPRGPWGIPLFGYVPFLTEFPHKKLMQLSSRYGPVFGFSLGPTNVVAVNGWPAIKEALTKQELLARPSPEIFAPFGVVANVGDASGQLWQENRKLVLHSLVDCGIGKSVLEAKLLDEIDYLCNAIRQRSLTSDAVDLHELVIQSVSNMISILAFGQRYEYGDNEQLLMVHAAERFANNMALGVGLQTIFPWLGRVFCKLGIGIYGQMRQDVKTVNGVFRKRIEEHRKSLDRENARDFIDTCLIRYEEGGTEHLTNDDRVCANMFLLMTGGMDTVLSMIEFIVLLMATHPDIQAKVQRELDDVIGSDRQVTWSDRHQLPYTYATMLEVYRWTSVAAIGAPRRAMETVTVHGVTIPKDTQIMLNLYSVHYDPEVYPQPEVFDPNRFYDANKNEAFKREQLIPFSGGTTIE